MMDVHTRIASNAEVLEKELLWFSDIVKQRIEQNNQTFAELELPRPPPS